MQYLGDYAADEPIYFIWNTTDSAGGSVTRTVDGTISVYKDASNGTGFDQTQVTTGVTNVEDYDGLTGVHSCCIVTTNAWYETGHSYAVVLSGATVGGQTVNSVIAQFSIESRSPALATALTTIDNNVDAILTDTNELQVDWKNGGRLDHTLDLINADAYELYLNQNDWLTATGFSTHSAADVKTAIEVAGSKLTAVKDKTDNLPSDPAAQSLLEALLTPMQTDLDTLIDEIGGKWEIISNQMIFYKSDNITEVMRFNLFDVNGNPTIDNVTKRERV